MRKKLLCSAGNGGAIEGNTRKTPYGSVVGRSGGHTGSFDEAPLVVSTPVLDLISGGASS